MVLVLDGASNLLCAAAQSSLSRKQTIQALRLWTDESNCMPKARLTTELMVFRECPSGSRTPWPNRAETAVRLFKRQWQIMPKNLEDDSFKGVTIREAVYHTVWARSTPLTALWKLPLVEDHQLFWTLKHLILLISALNLWPRAEHNKTCKGWR